MRQGLIAQWHRRIAARGLAGACLLMIPVLVAATIGLGGVGSGLSSLATGPSASAVGTGLQSAGHESKGGNLEQISAVLTSTRLGEKSRSDAGGSGGNSNSGAPAGAPGTGGSQTDQTDPSGSGSSPSPSGTSASTGTGGGTTSPPPADSVDVPASSPDMLNELLQNLGLAPAP